MRLLQPGIHGYVNRMRKRYRLAVAFVSGMVGGVSFAFFAHAEYEISSWCAPFAARPCNIGYVVEQLPDQSRSTAFSPIFDYPLLLGSILGSVLGLAIAPHLRTYLLSIVQAGNRHCATQDSVTADRDTRDFVLTCHSIDSRSAPLTASSTSSIDLTQFCSSDVDLTPKQRDILQCLWFMAVIAPHSKRSTSNSLESSILPLQSPEYTSSGSTNDSRMTWEWIFERIQPSDAAFDDVSIVLTELGFSKQTILTAWHIARDCIGNQST